MVNKKVKYEGKIKIKDALTVKTLLGLLEHLTRDRGFAVKKFESDEVKLSKEFVDEPQGENEIRNNVTVEIEIEVSDDEFEIEIESANLELVTELTTELSDKL